MTLEMSRMFVLAANAIFAASEGITTVPDSYMKHEGEHHDKFRKIIGIDQIMNVCAEQHKTFSELGVEWAQQSRERNIADLSSDWISWAK